MGLGTTVGGLDVRIVVVSLSDRVERHLRRRMISVGPIWNSPALPALLLRRERDGADALVFPSQSSGW